MNAVTITGNVVKDPVEAKMNNGSVVVRFTVAVHGSKDTTDFIDCKAWNNSAEYVLRNVGKGTLVGVQGPLKTGSYVDKNGINRKTVEVWANTIDVMNRRKNAENDGTQTADNVVPMRQGKVPAPQQQTANGFTDVDEDVCEPLDAADLPF